MKLAVVTGGADAMGIGWASAMALAEDGHEVIVTGVSDAEVGRAPAHKAIRAVKLDVRDEAAVNALFGGLARLDALVNCAGAADPEGEYDPVRFHNILDINLTGTLRCCVAARPLLAEAKGAIVNIASMHAIFGNAMVPAYSSSKGGVVLLTKSLARAWAPEIRVNAVAPGFITTNMARAVWENPEWAPQIIARTPMGRFGDPSELGDPIRFLCSPAARFITGVMIPVDGGYTCDG